MTPAAGIVVAAGSGERLGADTPKALVTVGGRTLVALAHEALVRAGVDPVVVVAPPDHVAAARDVLPAGTTVVAGGARRADSVRAGLAAVPAGARLVAVHDAARALVPVDVVRATVAAVTGDVVAAAPGLPVADTLKRVDGDTVVGTVDRHDLVAVQTPQVIRADVIAAAHADAGDATDDLALVEGLLARGDVAGRVVVTPGSPLGLKITYAHDLKVAAALAGVTA